MALPALPVKCPFPVGSLLKCKSAMQCKETEGGCIWSDTPFMLLTKPEMVEASKYEKDRYAFYRVQTVVSCQVFVPSTCEVLELRMMLDRWTAAMHRTTLVKEK